MDVEFDIGLSDLTHKEVSSRHVYTGLCDGVKTRWITFQHPWNGKLRFVRGEYMDSDTKEILVYEEDEEEYSLWEGDSSSL